MDEPGWERATRRPSRVRTAAVVLLGVVVLGLVARTGDEGGAAPGTLDVDPGTADSEDSNDPTSARAPDPSDGPDGSGAPEGSDGSDASDAEYTDPAPRRHRPPRTPLPAPPSRPRPEALPAEWRSLPPAPVLARSGTNAVWSGRALLIWGGTVDDGFGHRTFLDDGAALEPVAGTWRGLPAAPLSPRGSPAAAWTGQELVVWGGEGRQGLLADGARYDPNTDRWRQLAIAPLSPRAAAAAVWTGTELLVVGGRDNAGGLTDGAAYDPTRDAWRPIAPLPDVLSSAYEMHGLWTGDALVVWAPSPGAGLGSGPVRYDPAADTWADLPAPEPGNAAFTSMAWTGSELLGFWTSFSSGRPVLHALAPGAAAWEERAEPPGRITGYSAPLVAAGQLLVALTHEPTVASSLYDPAADRWATLPAPPGGRSARGGTQDDAVWTGTELLVVASPLPFRAPPIDPGRLPAPDVPPLTVDALRLPASWPLTAG